MKKEIFNAMLLCSIVTLALSPASKAPVAKGDLELPAQIVDSARFEAMLDPDAGEWESISPSLIHLNRTPPMYVGDAPDDGYRPQAFVKLARAGDDILVLLQWSDESVNIAGHGKFQPDAGEEHVYVKHSQQIDVFGDAACVMLPRERGELSEYPSIVMGQDDMAVDLLFWRAGEGFSQLQAHGRATVEKTDSVAPLGKFALNDGGWKVVMSIRNVLPGTPLCFAIWDGGKQQRNGLKFFSLWYAVH